MNSLKAALLATLWAVCLIPAITSLLAQDDSEHFCDHGTRGWSTRIDLEKVEKSLKRAESSMKPTLPKRAHARPLERKVGTDLPACRSGRRLGILLESPAPKAAMGSRLVFARPDELPDGEFPEKTALLIVEAGSLSETIRWSTRLNGRPDLGVYLASAEIIKEFRIECVPATVTFTSRTDALVEMAPR